MYTEAVVRSTATLSDYHVGLRALPNSLKGYSLNVPPAGSQVGAGVPRLRYAQQTTVDDPLFPLLTDPTKTINPSADSSVFFLGQGILRTAETGTAGYIDGPAAVAAFNAPINVQVDGAGNVFVSDRNNHRVRKIDTTGNVTTYAGSGTVSDWADGTGPNALFNDPIGLAIGAGGTLYEADYGGNRIRVIAP